MGDWHDGIRSRGEQQILEPPCPNRKLPHGLSSLLANLENSAHGQVAIWSRCFAASDRFAQSNSWCVYSWLKRVNTRAVLNSQVEEAVPHTLFLRRSDRDPKLPLILTEDADIEAICPIAHAGQAKAVMQLVVDPRGGMLQPGVVVSEITPSGWVSFHAHLASKGSS